MRITDKQITQVMADFNFDKAASLYEFLKWEWGFKRGKAIHNKEDLINEIYSRLKELQVDCLKYKGADYHIESGGLRVSATIEEGFDEPLLKIELIALSGIA